MITLEDTMKNWSVAGILHPCKEIIVSGMAINAGWFQMYYTGSSNTVRAIVIDKLIFPKLWTIFGKILNETKWNLTSIYMIAAILENSAFTKMVQKWYILYVVKS